MPLPNFLNEGTPVPIEIIHLMFSSRGSVDQISLASVHSCRMGLFAPVPPSVNSLFSGPIAIGSKNNEAAEVVLAASQIFVTRYRLEEPRGGG